ITFKITRFPSKGNISGQPPNLKYTPNPNFFGTDSFDFVVNDGKVDSQSATVTITIVGVNDPPIANSQSVEVDEDSQITITLTGSDPENDNLTYKIISQPLKGSLSGTGSVVIYKPNADFNGDDSFTFSVNDGELESSPAKVSIKVKPINDPPVVTDQSVTTDEYVSIKVILSGTDIDGDKLTFKIVNQPKNGTLDGKLPELVYKPNYGFGGEDSFTFVANDGKSDSAPATIKIMVNLAPNPVDINRDGIVNILDLVIIGIYYGKDDFPTDHNPDVNRDRKVDDKDLEIVKNNFGKKF
ncbi:TPA: tandem-95 repeat protein, partial [Candidatus Poribacteria bacterium]|nr:tandem-95 repeat protein [Candidatus Poribacteria bacterium]